MRAVMGSLRVDAEQEAEGLDVSLHSESAYSTGAGSSLAGLASQDS